MTLNIYVSFNHTLTLFQEGGFAQEGLLSFLRIDLAAVIATELVFFMGCVNIINSHIQNRPAGYPAYLTSGLGVILIGWSNVYAQWEYGLMGFVLGLSVPIGIVLSELMFSHSVASYHKMEERVNELDEQIEKSDRQLTRLNNSIKKVKNESVGIKELIEKFPNAVNYRLIEEEIEVLNLSLGEDGVLNTIVELDFHHKDSKMLRKDMNANNREIKKLLTSYESRYTTKANKTIYHLMVIGLQAELQNILYTLSYTNLEKALSDAENLIEKYLTICGNGNASILPTITRFLSELKPLFKNAIDIEYRYYIRKEKEKEEQRRIKEQMKQEAEERRMLEQERKKLEDEEGKYLKEILKNKELLINEKSIEKIQALETKIRELEGQVDKIEEKKEEIVKRANGKAGYVYVISNLGSFGENVFKIGMTRRLNPQDRIDELGDASVPFKFDVHAMIFSEDAVGLEKEIHKAIGNQRVNKINLRKEFFYSDITGLEKLVQKIDPTVEFIKTMKALEYRQSQSVEEVAS